MKNPATIEELERVHRLALREFPHEYLDEGLGAVGLFLNRPPRNAGYQQTPVNSVTFAGIGVDGIHFGSLTKSDTVDPDRPVVITIPMAFDSPNFIVGESLFDFLCLGCTHGYSNLGDLHLNLGATLDYYAHPPGEFFDTRAPGILRLLSAELALRMWSNVHNHFRELQTRFRNEIVMA